MLFLLQFLFFPNCLIWAHYFDSLSHGKSFTQRKSTLEQPIQPIKVIRLAQTNTRAVRLTLYF